MSNERYKPLEEGRQEKHDGDLTEYSEEFQEFVRKEGMEKLLKECHFHGSFEEWKKERKSAAKLIDREGTILDFGCANGFLLACLREWSKRDLECFGVDTDKNAIENARTLFPKNAEKHFPLLEEIAVLPEHFDMVYWNVWDDIDLSDETGIQYLSRLKGRIKGGGRMILGFYHPDAEENAKKVKWLQENGYVPTQIMIDENGHQFVAIDIPEEGK